MTQKKKSSKQILFTEFCSGTPFSHADKAIVVSRGIWYEVMERLDAQERTLIGQINWMKRNSPGGVSVTEARREDKIKELELLRGIKERLSLEIEEI